MSLKTNADKIKAGYIDACNAILARGGYVPNGMPIGELDEAIKAIPRDQVLAYYKQVNSDQVITVPQNTEPYARIGKIGGMTYKTENLIPFPYDYNVGYVKEAVGVKFTILADGGISVVGTPTSTSLFTFISADVVDLTNVCQAGKQYTISGGQTGILVVAHRTPIDGSIQSTAWLETSSAQSKVMPEGYKLYRVGIYIGSASVGTAINTVIYPMLNEGTVAKPYSPFFTGLRNAAVSEMKSEGANYIPFPYHQKTDKTEAGVTFHIQEDGGIAVSGVPTGYCEFPILSKYSLANFPSKFTISVQGNSSGVAYDASLWYKDNSYVIVSNSLSAGVDTAIDLSDYPNARYLTLGIKRLRTGLELSGVVYPMINYGTTAKPYRKYVGHLDTLPIPQEIQALDGYGGGVSGYPNDVEFDSNKFVRRTYRKVFDGTENILDSGLNAKGQSRYAFPIDKKAKDSMREILCVANHYPNGTVVDTYSNSGNVIGTNGNYIWWIDSEIPIFSLADMQAKLKAWYDAGDPLIVDYVLAEPIETDISAYLTDEFIKVESDGTITAVNEHNYDMPTEVNYIINTVGG
jgi:hypothetical protein